MFIFKWSALVDCRMRPIFSKNFFFSCWIIWLVWVVFFYSLCHSVHEMTTCDRIIWCCYIICCFFLLLSFQKHSLLLIFRSVYFFSFFKFVLSFVPSSFVFIFVWQTIPKMRTNRQSDEKIIFFSFSICWIGKKRCSFEWFISYQICMHINSWLQTFGCCFRLKEIPSVEIWARAIRLAIKETEFQRNWTIICNEIGISFGKPILFEFLTLFGFSTLDF